MEEKDNSIWEIIFCHIVLLVITPAGSGCGGDLFQFLLYFTLFLSGGKFSNLQIEISWLFILLYCSILQANLF